MDLICLLDGAYQNMKVISVFYKCKFLNNHQNSKRQFKIHLLYANVSMTTYIDNEVKIEMFIVTE